MFFYSAFKDLLKICSFAKTKNMDNDLENYEPSELLKSLQGLLKNYCFKLEGLSDECERSFIHIIKHLGGKISKNAKYTLVEKSYFDKNENKNRKDLYHLCFILDCIDYRKVLNIESYRCNKIINKSNENSPLMLQNKSKNIGDNIGKITVKKNLYNQSDSNDLPVQKTVIQSKLQNNHETLKKNISNTEAKELSNDKNSDNGRISDISSKSTIIPETDSDNDAPISERISQSKSQNNNKTLKKNISNVNAKRFCKDNGNNIDNGNISDASTTINNLSNESNSDEDALISERINPPKLQDNNRTLKKNISNVNAKKSCNDNRSDRDESSIDIDNISDASTKSNLSNKSNSDEGTRVSKVIKNSKLKNNNKIIKNSKGKKRKIYNDTRTDSESSASNELAKIKSESMSSDSSVISPKLKINNSKTKKRKVSSHTSSDSESSSSSESVKIKREPKPSDSSEEDSSSSNDTLSKKMKVNVKREAPSSSNESTNNESDSEPLQRKKRKKVPDSEVQNKLQQSVSQNKIKSSAIRNTWVNTKHLKSNKNKNNEDNNNANNKEEEASSNSRVDWTKEKIEERKDLKWLFKVDKHDLCNVRNCTFEPGPHTSHGKQRRVISTEEKHIILKYLIKNKCIPLAKGSRTWEIMNSEGYLTHRTPETLRNCLRRIILPSICSFGLPVDILDQFLHLDETREKGHKAYAQVKKGISLN